MLRPFACPVACCLMLLRVVARSLKPVKLFSQLLPTFLLFRDRRSLAQHCWIRLHSSSNIVGATQAHYAWFTKTYGLHPSHVPLQVPTLLEVVASVYTPLPTRTQQLPTLLLCPFARSLTVVTIFFFVQCIIKQLLDSVFVIPRIIKLSVRLIGLSLRLRLITPSSTSIILDITKTSSNNCLKSINVFRFTFYKIIRITFSGMSRTSSW